MVGFVQSIRGEAKKEFQRGWLLMKAAFGLPGSKTRDFEWARSQKELDTQKSGNDRDSKGDQLSESRGTWGHEHQCVKLPEILLKEFTGHPKIGRASVPVYCWWSISGHYNVHKLNHMLANMVGSASRSVTGYPVIPENHQKVLEKLTK